MEKKNRAMQRTLTLLLTLAMALGLSVTAWAVAPVLETLPRPDENYSPIVLPCGYEAWTGRFSVNMEDKDSAQHPSLGADMRIVSVKLDGESLNGVPIDEYLTGVKRKDNMVSYTILPGLEPGEYRLTLSVTTAEAVGSPDPDNPVTDDPYGCTVSKHYRLIVNPPGAPEFLHYESTLGLPCLLPDDQSIEDLEELRIDDSICKARTSIYLDPNGGVYSHYGPGEQLRTVALYYTLLSWNTKPDGSGTTYLPGDVIKFSRKDREEGLTLYAQWRADNPVWSEYDTRHSFTLVWEGYVLKGYSADLAGKQMMKPGDKVEPWQTFFAQWEKGTALTITRQPQDTYVRPGGTATLSVEAVGEGDLTYQWYRKWQASDGMHAAGDFVEVTDQATVRIPADQAEEGCRFYCVVTDKYGNRAVSEDAAVTVNTGVVAEYSPGGWSVQALEGYLQPLTGSISMSVRDDKTWEVVPFAVDGFMTLDYTSELSGGEYGLKYQTWLTCKWEDGAWNLSLAAGLPAGNYRWVLRPLFVDRTLDVQEFIVTCQVTKVDGKMVYYDGNCPDLIWLPPEPTSRSEPLSTMEAERSVAYCTLDANGGEICSVKGTKAPTARQVVHWAFTGWNTAPNGSGAAYQPGAKYLGPGGEILYAQWGGPYAREIPGGSGGNQWVERPGYAFLGWFSEKTGGVQLTEETPAPPGSVWYARWDGLVTYDGNGGTGVPAAHSETENIPGFRPQRQQEEFTLDANGGIFHHPKTTETTTVTAETGNWAFTGWNTKADGSGKTCQPGDSAAGLGGKTLYAQWSGLYPIDLIGDTDNGLTWVERTNHTFLGWFSEKTGGVQLTEETPVPPGSVWYARWEVTDPSVLVPAVGDMSLSDGYVSVQVTCSQEGAWVWCAVYDENGQMLGVEKQPARVEEDETYVFEFGEAADTATLAEVFLLSADGEPLCASNSCES